jgi:hypothetical protein
MTICADSSIVIRLYLPSASSSEVVSIREYIKEDNKVLTISELCRLEVLNVLLRAPANVPAEQFEQDLQQGLKLRLEPVNWNDTFQRAESLARRFSRILRPGGDDLVLVAAAVIGGATWFLSMDRNSGQRQLAGAAGLRVWPPLDKEEKGLVRHAIQRGGR